MAKIFIHAGAHKTATTLLQRALYDNQKYLALNNIKVVTRKSHPGLDFSDAISIHNAVKESEIVIISYEGFFSTLGQLITSKRPIYTDMKAAFSAIQELELRGHDVNVIFYIRKPSSFIESVYLEFVSSGNLLSFNEFKDKSDLGKFNWRAVIKKIKESLPDEKIIIKNFENEISRGSQPFLNRFASIVKPGLKLSFPKREDQNRSFSGLALKVALASFPSLSKEERVI
jgi:hypothetical protein